MSDQGWAGVLLHNILSVTRDIRPGAPGVRRMPRRTEVGIKSHWGLRGRRRGGGICFLEERAEGQGEGVGSHQQDKIRRVSRRSWEYKLG